MVRVIAISNPRLALAFVDYMATQGIRLELRNSGEAAEIWLADDGHLEQVQHELQQFLADPLNRRYQAASWQTGHTDAGLHYQSESYLHTLRSKAGPLTLGVMVLCIAVYILMQALGDDTVMYWLSWPQDSSQYTQLWRWVSHAFLHFSLLHILFNLMWWWYLGGQMEKRLSRQAVRAGGGVGVLQRLGAIVVQRRAVRRAVWRGLCADGLCVAVGRTSAGARLDAAARPDGVLGAVAGGRIFRYFRNVDRQRGTHSRFSVRVIDGILGYASSRTQRTITAGSYAPMGIAGVLGDYREANTAS